MKFQFPKVAFYSKNFLRKKAEKKTVVEKAKAKAEGEAEKFEAKLMQEIYEGLSQKLKKLEFSLDAVVCVALIIAATLLFT